MPVYGNPLELHVRALLFSNMAGALSGKRNSQTTPNVANEALEYIRTAITHTSVLRGKRIRSTRRPEFSLISWCHFHLSSRFRKKEVVLPLVRTLRRIRKGILVTPEARASVSLFFTRLADECSSKGDSSSMTIGDSDD
jgi:hypothetical protein